MTGPSAEEVERAVAGLRGLLRRYHHGDMKPDEHGIVDDDQLGFATIGELARIPVVELLALLLDLREALKDSAHPLLRGGGAQPVTPHPVAERLDAALVGYAEGLS